ncbi:hypothetical protein ABT282_30940 [Streptomyces sp. NPDC000927]|uniref:hypothetical protein n=1 Tax=Streptomyces sp. NPDC000927 TaxID=3154371 RepID=UPI00332C3E41
MTDINPHTDVPISLEAAREGDGYHASGGRQWSQLCHHMSSGEKDVLGILASLINETRGWNSRKLTLKHIAACLPAGKSPIGAPRKFTSTSTVRHLLKGLAEIGQITAPDGSPLRVTSKEDVPMTILVHTYPRHDCEARRNYRDTVAVLDGEDPWWGLTEVEGTGVPPKRVRAATPREERPSKAPAPRKAPESAPAPERRPAVSDQALALAMEVLPGKAPDDVHTLAVRIHMSVGSGWALEDLRKMLRAPYSREKVTNPTGLLVSRLPKPGQKPLVKPAPVREKKVDLSQCPDCCGSGNEEDENGDPTGRKCMHPALV